MLPIGLVHDLTCLTPVGSTVIGFISLALGRIGRDLEDPFENTLHGIPMQTIGSESVPFSAWDGVLW